VRVDYSELVVALQTGDETTANDLLGEVMPRLVEYLRVVMKADENVANECAQQAFADVYERIRKDKIKDRKYIFSYLLTATRNEFLRYSKFQHRFDVDSDEAYEQVEPAEQVKALIDQERMSILEDCLYELDRDSRSFIRYIMDNPDMTSKEYGKHFKLTEANVRTKKSRIISMLHLCYKRKSSQ
jgi:RNA polymerase sigma factor (sigma-70 family)